MKLFNFKKKKEEKKDKMIQELETARFVYDCFLEDRASGRYATQNFKTWSNSMMLRRERQLEKIRLCSKKN